MRAKYRLLGPIHDFPIERCGGQSRCRCTALLCKRSRAPDTAGLHCVLHGSVPMQP